MGQLGRVRAGRLALMVGRRGLRRGRQLDRVVRRRGGVRTRRLALMVGGRGLRQAGRCGQVGGLRLAHVRPLRLAGWLSRVRAGHLGRVQRRRAGPGSGPASGLGPRRRAGPGGRPAGPSGSGQRRRGRPLRAAGGLPCWAGSQPGRVWPCHPPGCRTSGKCYRTSRRRNPRDRAPRPDRLRQMGSARRRTGSAPARQPWWPAGRRVLRRSAFRPPHPNASRGGLRPARHLPPRIGPSRPRPENGCPRRGRRPPRRHWRQRRGGSRRVCRLRWRSASHPRCRPCWRTGSPRPRRSRGRNAPLEPRWPRCPNVWVPGPDGPPSGRPPRWPRPSWRPRRPVHSCRLPWHRARHPRRPFRYLRRLSRCLRHPSRHSRRQSRHLRYQSLHPRRRPLRLHSGRPRIAADSRRVPRRFP